MTIRSKIIVGYLAIIGILVAAASVLLFQYQELVQHTIGHRYTMTARSMVDRIDRTVRNKVEVLHGFAAAYPELAQRLEDSARELERAGSEAVVEQEIDRRDREWVAAFPRHTTALMTTLASSPESASLRRLRRFYADAYGYDVFGELFITNRLGVNVAQTGPTSDYRQGDEAWWLGARDRGVWIGDIQFDDSAGVYSQELAVAIAGPRGQFAGVLKAVLNVAELHSILETFSAEAEYETSAAELVDGGGGLLFRGGVAGAGEDNVADEPAVAQVLAGHDGYMNETPGADGQLLLRAYAGSRDPEQEWSVILNFDPEEVFGPLAILWRGVVIVGLGTIAIAAVLGFLIPTSILRPLGTAVTAADRLARGDLGADVRATTNDEAGQLLRAMERTVGYIKEVAGVAERIADGDVRVEVVPVSERDQLNRSFARTVEYLTGVAKVAERVAANDLSVSVAPRSDADVLNHGLSHMITSLRSVVEHLAQSANLIVETAEQLANASQRLTAGAGEQAVAADTTSSAMDDMNRSIDQVASSSESLREHVRRTSESIRAMADSIQEVAGSATDLSRAAMEATGTMVTMDASIDRVADHARAVGAVSETAVIAVREGKDGVDSTAHGMTRISQIIAEVVAVIQALETSGREIGRIVEVIDDIAEQSNLLALNAAITAAQAGDHGGGFSVVASEIRRLATHSRGKAQEIAVLVDEIQGRTRRAIEVTNEGHKRAQDGVALASRAGAMLERIGETVGAAHGRMGDVITATEEHARSSARAISTIETMVAMVVQIEEAAGRQAGDSTMIADAVHAIDEMGRRVVQAGTKQSAEAIRVREAVGNIIRISGDNRGTATELASLSGRLGRQAQDLQALTRRFEM